MRHLEFFDKCRLCDSQHLTSIVSHGDLYAKPVFEAFVKQILDANKKVVTFLFNFVRQISMGYSGL